MDVIYLIINSLIYILPAYVTNAAACIFGGGRPLDSGRLFIDGRRIMGNGVTYRGTFFGLLCGVIVALLEGIFFNINTFENIVFYYGILEWVGIGLLLSSGALFGDMLGSFIKRRLGFAQGRPVPLLDQLGFVVFAILFAYPFAPIPWDMIILLLIITPLIHLLSNILAYLLGIKKVWW